MVTAAAGLIIAPAQEARTSVESIETLIRAHDYTQALQQTKTGLNRNPGDFRLWTLQGIVLSIEADNTDALSAFRKALSISPNYVAALKGEVQLLYPTGDPHAVQPLEKILAVDPGDQTAQEMLAMLEKRAGHCEPAVDHFAGSPDSIQAHPASLEAYGDCLVQLDRAHDAIPVFQRLVTLLPDRTYPRYDLGVVLIADKQNDAALTVLDPLLTPDQQDPDVLSLASEAYEAAGNTPKSVALLRQAIVLSPVTASYYVAFASLCLDHESFQVGIDMVDAGLKRIPNDPSLYISRGLLYAQLAQFDGAEADFNRAEQLDSALSLGSYAMDLAELAKNNPDQALLKVRSQLKAHPESPLLHYLLAELIMNQAPAAQSPAFREALRSVSTAIKLQPDLMSARDLLASIYLRSGQYDLAIEQSRIALKKSPSDQTAAYHLLIALRHSGENNGEEMKALAKRIAEMHQTSMRQESDRKRYRLVEQDPPSVQ
jgi:tetratricopeptide (TPR) repeat protein